MSESWIEYVEPVQNGMATVRITERDAIQRMQAILRSRGYSDVSDESALAEFMVIHWAHKVQT